MGEQAANCIGGESMALTAREQERMRRQSQGLLFDAGPRAAPEIEPRPVPHNGTDTSRAAAEALRETESIQRQRIYDALLLRGRRGATDHQLAELTGYELSAVNGRRNRLVRDGLVVDSGRRQTVTREFGKTTKRTIWVAVEVCES